MSLTRDQICKFFSVPVIMPGGVMAEFSEEQKQYVDEDLSRRISGAVTEIFQDLQMNSKLITPLKTMPAEERRAISKHLISNLLIELMDALPYERKAHLLMAVHRDIAGHVVRNKPAVGIDGLAIAMFGDPLSPTREVMIQHRTAQPQAPSDEDQHKS